MNTDVTRAGQTIGYYYWCSLSKSYIAVKANGDRATARHQFQAVRFIES